MASRAHAAGTTRREVRRMFEPTRIAEDCLADAYARLVPVIGRHVPVDLPHRAGDDKTSAARSEHERQEGGTTMNATQAALYARVSTERQVEAQTIGSQVAALRERAVHDGFVVDPAQAFIDDGFSGATLVRPALEPVCNRRKVRYEPPDQRVMWFGR